MSTSQDIEEFQKKCIPCAQQKNPNYKECNETIYTTTTFLSPSLGKEITCKKGFEIYAHLTGNSTSLSRDENEQATADFEKATKGLVTNDPEENKRRLRLMGIGLE